ncbi:hypothetical protein D3C71_2095720 [compost metagenome]
MVRDPSRNQLQLLAGAPLRLDQGLGAVDHMGQAQVAGAQRRVHILGRTQVALLGQLLEVHRRQRQARQFAL